jgi:hypothetical protein
VTRPGAAAAAAFAALELPVSPELTDDDVRAAWRRVAAATHPDRADGGDPTRFAAAAAAYTVLRTRSGRGELLADGAASGRLRRVPGAGTAAPLGLPAGQPGRQAKAVLHRVAGGRPWRLALRLLTAACACAAAVAAAGWQPATPALITGALTWLALTARHDLAPRG